MSSSSDWRGADRGIAAAMSRSLRGALVVLCCVLTLALAGCGASSSSSASSAGAGGTGTAAATSSVALPTTKFLLHAGLAFGAFHHWIYQPIRAGALRHPFSHKLALIKAGLAALFVSHELRLAVQDARASKVLKPVVAPLTAAANKLEGLKSAITGGSVNPSALDGIDSQLGQAGQAAQSAGHAIQDAVPSGSQLATGSG